MTESQPTGSTKMPLECGNCGCAILVEFRFDGTPVVGETREVCVTCDCGKANWLRLTATGPRL